MNAKEIIEKRKRIWNNRHDITYDAEYIKAVVDEIINNKGLRGEISLYPDLLIEMCMTVVDKQGKTIPFFLNEVQQDLQKKIHEFGGKKPIYVLKGRQQGITTFVTAMQLSYSIVRRNFAGFTITDKSENTLAIFQDKAKSVYDRLPAKLKPQEKFNNVRELFFEKLNSSWRTATATENVGRSKTLRFLHLSELAFFGCSLSKIQESLGETLPLDAIQIYETTANGFNDAKELWDKGSCLNVFYPWWMTKEYSYDDVSIIDEVKDIWLKERIEWLRDKDVSEKQIAWYVNKFNGYIDGKNSLRQEYPCFASEAFIASGECIFNTEALQLRKEAVSKLKCKTGYFTYDKKVLPDETIELSNIKFVEDITGTIKIFNDAEEGRPYVLGGDTAGEGSDNYTMQVIDNNTLKQVAVFKQNRLDDDLYAEQAYCLGLMYNIALIGIEVNFSGYPVKHLDKLGYPKQYYREMYDEIVQQAQYKHGFKTTSQTRPQIISELTKILREDISVLQDEDTIDECLSFIKTENGRAEAVQGKHDDLVMALAIAYGVRHQQDTYIEKKQPKKVEIPFALQTEDEQEENWIDWEN